MKTFFLIFSCLAISCNPSSGFKADSNNDIPQDQAILGIKNVLRQQEKAWNVHDLKGFMDGYWKNDSLKFYGNRGLTHGWQQTLDNYLKGYPTKDESGTLKFTIHDISKIQGNTYWVMGKYHLERPIGYAEGTFMIVFKHLDGHWKIVADMSC